MWVYTQVNLDSKSGEGKNALLAPISSYLFYAIKAITVSVTVPYLWRWKQAEQFSQDIMLPSTKPGLGKGAGRCWSIFVCLRPLGAIPQVMLAVVLQTFWCLTVNSQHGVDESASWKSLLLPLREFLGGSTATLCEREGEVDKPQFMSNAKVMPCRNLCPVAGWGWWWDIVAAWALGGCWSSSISRSYVQATGSSSPTTDKQKNPQQCQETKKERRQNVTDC